MDDLEPHVANQMELMRRRMELRRIDKFEASIASFETDGGGSDRDAIRQLVWKMRAEEEIRQQAAMLRLATTLVRDMQDRIIYWTRGAEKLYGYSQAEAVGQTSHELLKTKFPQPLSDIQIMLNRDGVWEGELEHSTRVGGRVVVASQWVLHKDASGKSSRILEVCADITALRRAELLQMRSQKLEALGTLAGGIAHDFNNILSAINGSAVLAISQFPPNIRCKPA